MKEREYVYRILLTFEDGTSYYMKSGKIYQKIGPARRTASYRIGLEEIETRITLRRLERNPDYVVPNKNKLVSAEVIPYALQEVNDNTIQSLPKGKFLYKCAEQE